MEPKPLHDPNWPHAIEQTYKRETAISMPNAGESKVRRILVIDDKPDVADTLVELLVSLGFKSHACYSAKDALLFLDKTRPDIIFLDIDMPEMNGYELVRILKEEDKLHGVPVVAVTGYGLENEKIRAIQAGFDAHIAKPISARDLREILTGDLAA